MKRFQNTIRTPQVLKGVGVHSGQQVTVRILPAAAQTGVVFKRTDQEGAPVVPACWSRISSTDYCTTLESACKRATLSTVEHFMSALWALRVDNLVVEVDGPEMPILDGSAAPWIDLLRVAGLRTQKAYKRVLRVCETLRVSYEKSWLEVSPAEDFSVSMAVPVDVALEHQYTYTGDQDFVEDIAKARTFSKRENIERMRAMGLIKGGTLDNALVLEGSKPLNPEGFRYADECARHKVLDLIGDWALSGTLIQARVQGYASGHGLNRRLLEKLLSDPRNFEDLTEKAELPDLPFLVQTAPAQSAYMG